MAVRSVGLGTLAPVARGKRGASILYPLVSGAMPVTKLLPADFTPEHRHALLTMKLTSKHELQFEVPGWRSHWLGAGEEKAVFMVLDPHNRAFAVEILARIGYLDGYLAEGFYLADLYVPGLANARWDSESLFGHIFSGRVRAREYIYGETLADCHNRRDCTKTSFLSRLLHRLGCAYASFVTANRYSQITQRYRDAHEANVMIELIPLGNPEHKSHALLPIPWLEEDGKLHLRYFRLTPVDVRRS